MGILRDIKNYYFPINEPLMSGSTGTQKNNAYSPNNYIAPVQFQRLKVDIKSLNDGISEAELAFYPHRVKLQRIYQDTIRNGQVHSALQRCKDLTLLKDFHITNGTTTDEKATELLKKEWFHNLLNYCLDAKFFGYTLVGLGEIIDNEFPKLQLIKRWNVNPGTYTMKPYLNSYVYSLSGINFLDPSILDSDGNSYYDWTIYVTTPTETGASPCGYGLLYKIAYYEILLRNNMGFNATANERFGMPIIWAKTTKTDEAGERSEFQSMVNNIGAAGGIVTDPMDEIEFIESAKGGKGADMYGNFDERMNKMINKIIFGHADAMDSQTGKLGGEDAAKESIEAVENAQNRWITSVVNTEILPKLINLGFPIPIGYKFEILNNGEADEQRMREDNNNKLTSEIVVNLKNAGYEVDENYITERMGIPVVKSTIQTGLTENVKTKLKALYDSKGNK
jgi:phage gp29-like protein